MRQKEEKAGSVTQEPKCPICENILKYIPIHMEGSDRKVFAWYCDKCHVDWDIEMEGRDMNVL